MQVPLKVLLFLVAGALLFAGAGSATTNSAGGAGAKYLVLYKSQAVPRDAATTIASAGGTLVYSYDQIGVAIAQSDNASFRDNLLKDNRIENASATAGFATRLPDEQAAAEGPPPGGLPNAPATDADTFSALQWDMRQIKSPEAHAITGGSPAVLAGDIDTGADFNHPDLRGNIDFSNSVSCIGGVPNQSPSAWNDGNGHGTHTAGTIAAPSNGIGIVGVAPRVKLGIIKAGTDDGGFFFPEAVVCAFVWAGTHHFDVTNNSYFADPFLFNCRNDPTQHAIWKAEQRAILFAEQQGVSVVASEGNASEDTAHPTTDATSPDFPEGINIVRAVTNACVIIPVEIPGVIGVSAIGDLRLKSFYSNFGVGVTQLAAPGGDSILQRTPAAVNGRVLSTWPPNQFCRRSKTETGDVLEPTAVYCYLQGTSMAAPHVTGAAALIISRFGSLRPGRVKALLDQTADPQPCPDAATLALYAPFPGTESGAPQTCQGGTGHNSWYGNGILNAFNAVMHTPGG